MLSPWTLSLFYVVVPRYHYRGKKQVWCPHVRTWGLLEANVLHRSTCDSVRIFRRPGNYAPSPRSLTPWLLRSATRLNKSWYTALTRGIWDLWDLGEENFSILPNFCATLKKTSRKVLQGDSSAWNFPKHIGNWIELNLLTNSQWRQAKAWRNHWQCED